MPGDLALKLGEYRLLNRLASGGMGEVYVGVRRGIGQFEKPMAIKLLLPHLALSEQAVQRFLDEARLSARMSHPNVAQVFDVGVDNERYFLAMELVRGTSLSGLIEALADAKRAPSLEVLTYIATSLCEALHHAHQLAGDDGRLLDVVHRDVTPHNVLVSIDGGVKLTDFGVARMRDSSESGSGRVVGKLSYMAPEQLYDTTVDRRADIYGLGMTLLQLATLERPRRSAVPFVRGQRHVELPSFETARPDLPHAFREVVQRCLAIDPAERFASARELRDALPLVGRGGDEALAALVKTHCATALHRFDEVTRRVTFDRGTESLVEHAPPPTAAPKSRPRWLLAATFFVLGFSGLSLAYGLQRHLAAPSVPTVEAVVPSTPPPRAAPAIVHQEPEPPPPPASKPVTKALRPKAEPLGTGYLSVDALPWAQVFVDGVEMGTTPMARIPLTAGRHRIRLYNPETGRAHEKMLQVRANAAELLKPDLR